MKRLFLNLVPLALAFGVQAQTASFYENDGIVMCPPDLPPQIDALNFINRGTFVINFTNTTVNSQLFDTANTLNFTNYGRMESTTGFELLTSPTYSGIKTMAGNVHNEGSIISGTSSNVIIPAFAPFVLFGIQGLPKFVASATNFVSPGVINMGFESVCSIKAQNIDLERGTVAMMTNGFSTINAGVFFNGGIFDGYWGLETNELTPAAYVYATPPTTPLAYVTNRSYFTSYETLRLPNALTYLDDQTIGSNRTVRVVFLSNTNAELRTRVYLPYQGLPYNSVVEWSMPDTNDVGVVTTNYLYLFDYFSVSPNFGLFLNGFAGAGLNRPTFEPANYVFYQTTYPFYYFQQPATPTSIPAGTFDYSSGTNQATAYEAIFLPTSIVLSDIASQDVTNVPGRITISAENTLNLTGARLLSLNYLGISATNTFLGSDGAKISAPYSDINLRATNGLLTVTNMLVPALPRFEGSVKCYSMRWTNEVGGITNCYFALWVDTQLAPLTPTRVQGLNLVAANGAGGDNKIVLHDVMNVTRSLLLDCSHLTLATNEPGSPTAAGGINLVNADILWATSTPRLRYLTNEGFITTGNTVFFGGSRSSPYYSTTYNEPYDVFINRGGVTNYGSRIWARQFENSGVFSVFSGAVTLENCASATLTNGMFLAPQSFGYIDVQADNLLVSNHVFYTAGPLTLRSAESLDDGSLTTPISLITNKNAWTVKGVNLTTHPTTSSLAATTITNISTSYQPVLNTWGGNDLGAVPEGFVNNAVLGWLVLDGRDQDSIFKFGPATGTNALYVDCLEFRNSVATNIDGYGNFKGVSVLPGMKVYYGQALANGVSIAEKLSGRNGFTWVSDYNDGYYSSTNIVYPDGSTNRLNTALVTSCDIDSNGNGIVNCLDPAPVPIYSSAGLALNARILSAAPRSAAISWNTIPGSTNALYSSSSITGQDWTLVTNFVSGASAGRVTVTEPISNNAVRFYRVHVGKP